MKALNDYITTIFEKLNDTSSNIDKQEGQLKEISSKLSTYEDRLEKMIIKETQIQPL